MAAAAFGLKDSSLVHTQGYIDGKWLDAKDGTTFDVTNPATDEVLGAVVDMGVAETKDAIAAASAAFRTWSQTTAAHRHDLLMKLCKLILENANDLARIVTLENGKVFPEAKGESVYSASYVEWFAEEAVRAYGEVIPSSVPNLRSVVVKQPVGVCGIVTPWNWPLAMITRQIAPALAAGCTVVIKPAPETPFSALAVADLATRAGIPAGVINIVTSSVHTKEIGKELCENPTIRKISFTGSTAVAKTLYAQSAPTMKRVSVEAGGHAPFIVFDDADLEAAISPGRHVSAPTASTSSRPCTPSLRPCWRRPSRLRRLVMALTPTCESWAVDKVEEHVHDAIHKGANVLAGGKRLQGNFFEPTVLADVPRTAKLCKEETFGPLVALIKFDTEEELIQSEYGLAAYLYSRDVGRVWRVAEALEVGMVGANTDVLGQPSSPFGGVKHSGLGREGSRHGLDEYLNLKYIAFGGL